MKFGDFVYENSFIEGDRVKLKSKKKDKKGCFVRYITYIDRTGHNRTGYALVLFDGNKTYSKILASELMYEKLTRKIYRRGLL